MNTETQRGSSTQIQERLTIGPILTVDLRTDFACQWADHSRLHWDRWAEDRKVDREGR